MDKKESFQKAVFDRVEGDKAIIKMDDGQQVVWPVSGLPEGLTEGDNLRLVIENDRAETAEREEMAKAILNKILKDPKKDG